MTDLSVPQHYVPGVTRTEITTTVREGVGASRLVYMLGLLPLRETVVDWQPMRGFSIALALKNSPMPWPVKHGVFRYQLIEQAGQTHIHNSLQIEYRGGLFNSLINLLSWPVVKLYLWVITRNMRRYYLQQQASASVS
jgi:hypothetical protein